MAAGHNKKDRNPDCICLIMNVPKHNPSKTHFPGSKRWVPNDLFQIKKFLNALRYHSKVFKSTLDRSLAFANKIPALVNLWVISMNGKNYQKKTEEPMLINKLKTQENEGATSKYPDHTDIKVFGHIPEVFVV